MGCRRGGVEGQKEKVLDSGRGSGGREGDTKCGPRERVAGVTGRPCNQIRGVRAIPPPSAVLSRAPDPSPGALRAPLPSGLSLRLHTAAAGTTRAAAAAAGAGKKGEAES